MNTRWIIIAACILIAGCATGQKQQGAAERSFNATFLTIDLNSDARQVIDAIPQESAMESFEAFDSQGRVISYAALTDTDTGALVFVNQKLHGTLSHRDAQALYSCRGYITMTAEHWTQDATKWVDSILASTKPATTVELEFSGKSSMQSMKEVVASPFVKRLRSLLGVGSNPLKIFGSLSSIKDEMAASAQFDNVEVGMDRISLGMSESSLDEIAKPEDIVFTSGGIVMSYPSHLVEYFVSGGDIKVIQRPSFHFLRRIHAALFYAPNVKWALCTPERWKEALPASIP